MKVIAFILAATALFATALRNKKTAKRAVVRAEVRK